MANRALAVAALWAVFEVACGSSEKRSGTRAAEAGAAGGESDNHFEPCSIEELAQHCAAASCPESPEDVTPFCADDFRGTTRSATECGGTVVHKNYGLGYTKYYFDAAGTLIGIVSLSDKGHQCADGRSSLVTQSGETCTPVGDPEDVCESAPATDAGGAGGMAAGGADAGQGGGGSP